MKYFFTLALSALLSLPATSVFALDRESDQRSERSHRHERGDVEAWCNRVTDALSRASKQALRETARGQLGNAFDTLRDALNEANQSVRYPNSLTAVAISRGVELSRVFSNSQSERRDLRTATHILQKQISFVLDVADTLDIPYYRPDCGYCSRHNHDLNYDRNHDRRDDDDQYDDDDSSDSEVEQNYLDAAKKQAQNLIDATVVVVNGEYSPVGTPELALNVLGKAAGYLRSDLRQSLESTRYACEIKRLRRIRAELDRASDNGGEIYDVMQTTVGEFSELVSNLNGCN